MADNASVLRIRQIRSRIGQTRKQHEVLRTLGLRHIGHVVERPDNPAVRGAVSLVSHLVEIADEEPAAPAKAKAKVKVTKKAAAKKTDEAKTDEKVAKATKKAKTTKKAAKKKTTEKKKSGGSKKKTTKKKKKKTTKKKSSGGKS